MLWNRVDELGATESDRASLEVRSIAVRHLHFHRTHSTNYNLARHEGQDEGEVCARSLDAGVADLVGHHNLVARVLQDCAGPTVSRSRSHEERKTCRVLTIFQTSPSLRTNRDNSLASGWDVCFGHLGNQEVDVFCFQRVSISCNSRCRLSGDAAIGRDALDEGSASTIDDVAVDLQLAGV